MGNARKAIKFDVVFGCELAQHFGGTLSQTGHALKRETKTHHSLTGRLEQFLHPGIPGSIVLRGAALLHFCQPVLQGFDQLRTALGIVQQVVLKVWVALHHPDIPQHLIEHAGRPSRAPLTTQLLQHRP